MCTLQKRALCNLATKEKHVIINMHNSCTIIFLGALFLNGVLGTGTGKHDPDRFSSFRAFSWVPVDLFSGGFWPARSARFAAREILGIGLEVPFYARVTSAWGTVSVRLMFHVLKLNR